MAKNTAISNLSSDELFALAKQKKQQEESNKTVIDELLQKKANLQLEIDKLDTEIESLQQLEIEDSTESAPAKAEKKPKPKEKAKAKAKAKVKPPKKAAKTPKTGKKLLSISKAILQFMKDNKGEANSKELQQYLSNKGYSVELFHQKIYYLKRTKKIVAIDNKGQGCYKLL